MRLLFISFFVNFCEIALNKKFVFRVISDCLISIGLDGCDQSPTDKTVATNAGSKVEGIVKSGKK